MVISYSPDTNKYSLPIISRRIFVVLSTLCTSIHFSKREPSQVTEHLSNQFNLYSSHLDQIKTASRYVISDIPDDLKYGMETLTFSSLFGNGEFPMLCGYNNLSVIILEKCSFSIQHLFSNLKHHCSNLQLLDISNNPRAYNMSDSDIPPTLKHLFLPRSINVTIAKIYEDPFQMVTKKLFQYIPPSLESIQLFSFSKKELEEFQGFSLSNKSIKRFKIDIHLLDTVIDVLEVWELEELVIYDRDMKSGHCSILNRFSGSCSIKIITIESRQLIENPETDSSSKFFFYKRSSNRLYSPILSLYCYKRKVSNIIVVDRDTTHEIKE
ncbi:hypothetical protein DFA_05567 [Cavenderia fasciculata]|uniref:Leucine-rich repeat-containing protein n=1 Tax=Cavenderia fasciculata TaxID=261658 RepID=F4PLL3_CACFS|nr:uncharacterized protein DFA_05567 [Cavenderia fasciculata]EGG23435.1 hypothetical protein DFA_05567 [Cavenderia fasciculata]|eukprot:XP_004361286.1 hypothetical protein DFA_05567 [Cavenderia fasciculata]